MEVDERMQELERRLMMVPNTSVGEDDDIDFSESEDTSEEDEEIGISTSRLKRHAHQLIYIQRLVTHIGPKHPFLVKQEGRILRLRQTVLLDLSNALKQIPLFGDDDKARMMRILGIYRELGEFEQALKALKEREPRTMQQRIS